MGSFLWLKVTANSVPNGLFEFFPGIGFGKDGMTQRASDVAALIRVFHQEKHFLCHASVSLGIQTDIYPPDRLVKIVSYLTSGGKAFCLVDSDTK
jgi:hypothetical protein